MNEQYRPTNKVTYFQTCNNRRQSSTGEVNEILKIIQVTVVKKYNRSCTKDGWQVETRLQVQFKGTLCDKCIWSYTRSNLDEAPLYSIFPMIPVTLFFLGPKVFSSRLSCPQTTLIYALPLDRNINLAISRSSFHVGQIHCQVTNNRGFWIGWLDLLTASFTITLNYNQL
jgi:hypothetical protein